MVQIETTIFSSFLSSILCFPAMGDFCREFRTFVGLYFTEVNLQGRFAPDAEDKLIDAIIGRENLGKLAAAKAIIGKNPNPYGVKEFWDLIEGSATDQVVSLLDAYYGPGFYSSLKLQVLDLHPTLVRFLPLFLDPAVMSKGLSFVKVFLGSPDLHGKSLFEVRSAFANALNTAGKVTLYRSLAVTKEQAEQIRREGMRSRGAVVDRASPFALFAIDPREGVARQFQQRPGSPFISATGLREVAGAITNNNNKNQYPPGVVNYVFKLEVPLLSVIARDRLGVTSEKDNQPIYLAHPGREAEARLAGYYNGAGIEAFLHLFVPPEQIVDHEPFNSDLYIPDRLPPPPPFTFGAFTITSFPY